MEESPCPFRHDRAVKFCLPLLALLFAGGAGCAMQSDLVDVQLDLDKMKERQARIEKSLESAGRLPPEEKGRQVDLAARVEQLASELQVIQGRVEELGFNVSNLSGKVDQQMLSDTGRRIDELEARLLSLEREARAGGGAASSETGRGEGPSDSQQPGGRLVLPGRVPGGVGPADAYNLAYNDYVAGRYDLAITGFGEFVKRFGTSSLVPNALFWMAESYAGKKDYKHAVEIYQRLISEYPKSERTPAALLKAGIAYDELGDRAKAKVYLKRVLEEYPRTNEANLAKNRLAEIR